LGAGGRDGCRGRDESIHLLMTGQARVVSKSLIVEQLRVPVKSSQYFLVLEGCEMVR
jgi:hypothetical protein